MTRIRFIQHDGREHEVEASEGESVMRAAVADGVPGIAADCGGSLSCATCHVYVPQEWLERLQPPSADEQAMLEIAVDPRDNSRLSCQIMVTPELEGLTLNVPESQF